MMKGPTTTIPGSIGSAIPHYTDVVTSSAQGETLGKGPELLPARVARARSPCLPRRRCPPETSERRRAKALARDSG